MKHLLPTRYLLTMLLAYFMAFGAQAAPLKYFVSAKTGNDSRSGTSWNSAFKTLKKALQQAETNDNKEVEIYLAEGEYDVGQKECDFLPQRLSKQGFPRRTQRILCLDKAWA